MRFGWKTIAAISLVTLAPSAHAFLFLKGTTYLAGERPVSQAPVWPTRNVTFYVNTNLAALGGSLSLPVSGAELLQSAEEGVNAWAAACRANLRVTIAGSTSGSYNSSDGINTIQWDNRTTGEGNYFGTDTDTLASAITVIRGTEFGDCDIVLNGNSLKTLQFTPVAGEADLRSVLTHEIGHCLGLDHPIDPPTYTSVNTYITSATMVQTAATGLDSSDPGRRDISQDDRDGIECIYERGKPLRTGVHCASYTGTNGNGALTGAFTGGPTGVDTACAGDAQGRGTLPSLDSGDGCIPSAIAATSPPGPAEKLGGSFGFFCAVAFLALARLFRRRFLHLLFPIFLIAIYTPPARAFELELSYAQRKATPNLWNDFANMDPTATQWSTAPNAAKMSGVSEIRATAFNGFTSWGKWGGALTFTLPSTLETTGQAAGSTLQTKRTTLSGLRFGPDFRWFPTGAESGVRWFVGGRAAIGIFYGSQTFANPTESQVSYRAWATELTLNTGAEIPIGALRLVLEGGYAHHRSSYFASTGNSGAGYADFPSGTRLASNVASGSEDVRFSGSGFYAALGLQMTFGSGDETKTEPKLDDYEPIHTAPKLEMKPEPTPEPKTWEIDPIPGDGDPTTPEKNPNVKPDQADPVPAPPEPENP